MKKKTDLNDMRQDMDDSASSTIVKHQKHKDTELSLDDTALPWAVFLRLP